MAGSIRDLERRPRRGPVIALAFAAVAALLATAAPAAATQRIFFSPSRNIGCELDWAPATAYYRAYCQTTHPRRSVEMGRNGRLTIHRWIGDPGEGRHLVLRYGRTLTVGGFACTSRRNGMTCVVRATGKGFRIAKGGVYRVA